VVREVLPPGGEIEHGGLICNGKPGYPVVSHQGIGGTLRVVLPRKRFELRRSNSEVFQYHSEPSLFKYPLDRFSLNLHQAATQDQLVEAVAMWCV